MSPTKLCLYVFILAFSAASHSRSNAEQFPAFSKLKCAANMSCVNVEEQKSPIPASKKSEVQKVLPVIDVTLCGGQKGHQRDAAEVEKACIEALKMPDLKSKDRGRFLLEQAFATQMLDISQLSSSEKMEERRTAKLFKRAIEADQDSFEAVTGLAKFYKMFGDTEASIAVFQQPLATHPTNPELAARFALALLGADRKEAALEVAQTANSFNSSDPYAIYALGAALYSNQNNEWAEQQLLKAQSVWSQIYESEFSIEKYVRPQWMLISIYLQSHENEKGLATVNDFILSNPNDWDLASWFETRAKFYQALGNLRQAADAYDEAIKLSAPEISAGLKQRRDELLLRTNSNGVVANNLKTQLTLGKLQPILRLQIFLRGQGYKTVEINGIFDDATQENLAKCLAERLCEQGAGDRALGTTHQ
jgi:tetratricopeptide (TPR) repeat protein